ncbi:uncharacterized protein PHACADRAFT_31822 [Phanerochaete carnosa HHB-10118-sp]|uniref:Uncharacterized protein n=1 Tax=Phanerochaete carnosa (strain HHB-10118-sp) TaxID=650164 RepID=K5VYY1_PHACS|nr:uncharacterized protein PHACADRAFT_31822 [Phanerochaete carnosa HHB-10118-sp]EKM52045.1 hypothetical protein PHACADRAFT_31822 [Phanerochaete carnosa HHB-10118-sp]
MILIPALIGYAQTAIFAGLRVFAITNRNRTLSLIVLILILAPVTTNSYVIAVRGVALPFIGSRLVICTPETLITGKLDLTVIGETIAILLTWKQAYHRQQDFVNIRGAASLTQTLIRDGTAYFMYLFTCLISPTATNKLCRAMILVSIAEILVITHGQSTAFAGPFLDALPPILVCRFIMNLRRSSVHSGFTEYSGTELDSPGTVQTASVVFRRFNQGLDEFGRSLDVGESQTRSGSTGSGWSRGGTMQSESTMEDYSYEGGIDLTVYVSPVGSSPRGANCALG